MKAPFLLGDMIYMRALDRSDAAVIVPWINDPRVRSTLLTHRPMSFQAEEDFIVRTLQSEHEIIMGIVMRETDRLVGSIGLSRIDFKDRHASFGILIGETQEWGKGIGTEATRLTVQYAFETLNLNRVWLHVYENHAAAIRAYQKVGFREEGRLRQHSFREGRYWDTITMGILREEWPQGS